MSLQTEQVLIISLSIIGAHSQIYTVKVYTNILNKTPEVSNTFFILIY